MSQLRSIVLIGMMGAGKSSVGRCLQRRTGLDRFDIDEIVSSKFGLSIPEIFSQFGEEKFRQAETEALKELAPVVPIIIVTGGGIVLRGENVELLKQLGEVVWLDAREDRLFERVSRRMDRPLLQTDNPRVTLSDMLAKRAPLYEKASDIRVDTTALNHDEVADIILTEIENRVARRR